MTYQRKNILIYRFTWGKSLISIWQTFSSSSPSFHFIFNLFFPCLYFPSFSLHQPTDKENVKIQISSLPKLLIPLFNLSCLLVIPLYSLSLSLSHPASWTNRKYPLNEKNQLSDYPNSFPIHSLSLFISLLLLSLFHHIINTFISSSCQWEVNLYFYFSQLFV